MADLPRNDARAAMAYARQESKGGRYTPATAQQLLMLQDDPGELLDLLNAAKLRVSGR